MPDPDARTALAHALRVLGRPATAAEAAYLHPPKSYAYFTQQGGPTSKIGEQEWAKMTARDRMFYCREFDQRQFDHTGGRRR